MTHKDEIGVLMTTGMSLEAWGKSGFLDRELEIYGKLSEAIDARIVFISYGGKKEIEFLGGDQRFGVVSKAAPALSDLAYSLAAGRMLSPIWKRLSLLKTNQMRGAWAGLYAQRVMKVPLIVRCGFEWLQDLELRQRGSSLYRWAVQKMEGHIYRRADAIMLPSPASSTFVQERFNLDSAKIHIFMNSINCNQFQPIKTLMRIPGRIVFIGRLTRVKRLELLLRAAARIDPCDVVLVGEEPRTQPGEPSYRAELEQLARDLSVKVHFYGRVPNRALPEILNQASVFVLPSTKEGNPKALMEAMACACPCIGTRVPGIVDVLDHERTGLLVEDEEDLTAAISRLFNDPALSLKLGQQAHRHAHEHFDLIKNIEREAALLQQQMRNRSSA